MTVLLLKDIHKKKCCLESKVLLSNNTFCTNLLNLHSLMPGASNLAILMFSTGRCKLQVAGYRLQVAGQDFT